MAQTKSFRLLWAGQSASLLGDHVTSLALPLVALAHGASVTRVALLAAAGQAPFVVLGLPAGVWVGRLGLRRSMLVADAVRGIALLSLPVAAAMGDLSYAQLLVVALVVGVGTVLFQIAYQSFTPLLVSDPAEVRSANSRLSASEAGSSLAGPALAGLLIGAAGAARALIADAATFAVSVLTLSALRAEGDQPRRSDQTVFLDVRSGFRFVLHSPPLLAILWGSVLYNLGSSGYDAVLVVYAVSHLGLTATGLGLALALGSTGVPLGLALSGPLERRVGVGRLLLLASLFSGLGPVVAAFAVRSDAWAVIAAATFVTALGGGAWSLTALTVRQLLTDPSERPMATAVHRWASYGVLPIGALGAGVLAGAAGVRTAVAVFGVIAVLGVVPLTRACVRRLVALPTRARTPIGEVRASSGSGAADRA